MSAITECFPLMSLNYPKLFLDFISSMQLENAPEFEYSSGSSFAHLPRLPPPLNIIVRGTSLRSSPRDIWSDLFQVGNESSGPGNAKTEVVPVRVPFENFAGSADDISNSPLHLALAAAQKVQDYDVFKSELMVRVLHLIV